MNCPVCNTECLENSQVCDVCTWEFELYVSDISEQEKKTYRQKLLFAQQKWNNLLKAKVYSEKTKVPALERDPFETLEEFKARIMKYPPIPAGKAKLFKKDYSFKIGEFPLKIEWEEWIQMLNKRPPIMNKNEAAIEGFCLHVPPNISKELYQSNQSFSLFIKLTFKDNNPLLDTIELFWNNQAFPVEPHKGLMKQLTNENQKDYIVRVTSYNDIVVGKCSLIKDEYDIETGKFPLKIKLEQWINEICNSSIYYPYIVVNRDKARELYEKSTKYPIKAKFEINDHQMPSINKYFIKVNNEKYYIEDFVSLINVDISIRDENKILIESLTKMELIYVPSGRFMMGDIFGNGKENERPVHEVQLDGFYIGKYPVTQGQWKSIMKKNPSHFSGVFKNNYPVECVSWNDIQEFIKQINEMNKNEYVFRLPTEAEWEYAARSGGKKEKYAGGDIIDDLAWYNKNSSKTTQPVGKERPNGLGLYDMSGNVWEWCEDIYFDKAYSKHAKTNPVYLENNSGSRVLRGGAWSSGAVCCRSPCRGWGPPGGRRSYVGFRLVSSPRSVI